MWTLQKTLTPTMNINASSREMYMWTVDDRLCGARQTASRLNAKTKNYEMKNDNAVPAAYIAAHDLFKLRSEWFVLLSHTEQEAEEEEEGKKRHTLYRQWFWFFVFLCICNCYAYFVLICSNKYFGAR